MALSGYSDNPGSIWRQLCSNSKNYLTDPYIRSIFTFLTAENGNYEAVLVSYNENLNLGIIF